MHRLSAADTVAALRHLGLPATSAATLRSWKHRGLISPGRGYDPREIAALYHRRVARAA